MTRAAAALLALLLACLGTAAGAEAAAGPPQPSEAALAFVEEFSDDHLSGMLSRIGGQSEAMRTLSQIDGRLLAATFDAEIDAAVARHGDEWARNLALAWSPLLTESEMASLVDRGAASPHADTYREAREAASARMADLSRDLFAQILQEVVAATLAALTRETPEEPAN